ncbi:hypothetical protein WBG99_00925 [Streptomyces sp. TG1A-60]|uniref:hypothetical protein n=1 Tax=Streptomyces sp. TG1A-60 TaxID=3129111 RepID=UPI0030D56AA8
MSAATLLAAVPAANASSPADLAGSAPADTTSRSSVSRSFTLPKGTTRASLSLGSFEAQVVKASQYTITCTLTVYTPWYVSLGMPPRIATQAETQCDSWVDSLSIRVELTRNGATAAVSDHQNFFSSSISTGTSALCAEGSWVAEADGDIAYPPLFWPPTADLSVGSHTLPISTCLN